MIIVEIPHQMPPRVYEAKDYAQAVAWQENRGICLDEWLANTDETFKAVFDDDGEGEFKGYTREITDEDRSNFLAHDLQSFYAFDTLEEARAFRWETVHQGWKVTDRLAEMPD